MGQRKFTAAEDQLIIDQPTSDYTPNKLEKMLRTSYETLLRRAGELNVELCYQQHAADNLELRVDYDDGSQKELDLLLKHHGDRRYPSLSIRRSPREVVEITQVWPYA